ncbi:hypothetical protein CDAR_393701 [Caerostris darwini]|uniref:Uncharacterized protein n=1 Tax=Caerostris darwini TaxID=1538125 RepID=A0AAV4W9I9_9ARAC|nr:hypothetical protein CDAR_393701 [Caerostris darwini]
MINTYENSKANEDNNLGSNLQSSADVLAIFQSLLRKTMTCASPERDQPHLNGRLRHQNAVADVKTDRIRRGRVWASISGCCIQSPLHHVQRAAGHRTKKWQGVILMKENHLPSELVPPFFADGIPNFD